MVKCVPQCCVSAVLNDILDPLFLPGISASVEMDFRDFLLSSEEVELTELVDILFLFFPNSSVMNSAIYRYGDLGYQEKLRTAPVSVFSPPLLVPVLWGGRFGTLTRVSHT